MSDSTRDFDPDDFVGVWKIFTAKDESEPQSAVAIFKGEQDGEYKVVAGQLETLYYKKRTRTLERDQGTRSISCWHGSDIPDKRRIFGARYGGEPWPFEQAKGDTGAWGAEDG